MNRKWKTALSIVLAIAMMLTNVSFAFADGKTINITADITVPVAGDVITLPTGEVSDSTDFSVESTVCEKYQSGSWVSCTDSVYETGKYRFTFVITGDAGTVTAVYVNGVSASTEVIREKLYVYSQEYTVHVHDFTQQSTDSRYCVQEATCSSKGIYYYSCDCGASGDTTFETPVNPDNHAGANHVWNASIDKRDDNYHWFVCTDCKKELTEKKTAHTWDAGTVTNAATVFAKGEKQYKCSGCSLIKKEEIPAITENVINCTAYKAFDGSMYISPGGYGFSSQTGDAKDEYGNVLRKDRDYILEYTSITVTARYLSKVYGSRHVCVSVNGKYYVFTVTGTREPVTSVVYGKDSYLEAGDYATSAVDSEKYSLIQGKDFTIENGKFVFTNAYLSSFGGNRTVTLVVDGFTYTETVKGTKILKTLSDSCFGFSFTNAIYNGNVQVPRITAFNGLVYNKDYTIEYSNSGSKAIGEYYIKIQGKGDYSGTIYTYYWITPKPTFIRSVDAARTSAKVRWKKRTLNVDGYVIEYSTSSSMKSSKKIYVSNKATVSRKITGLKRNKRYYIRMSTYKYVSGDRVCSKCTVTKTFRTAR